MKEGILGGTFDPPHLGHLILAQEAMERYSLQRVLFVPSRFPPHKDVSEVTDFSHRLRMLELAVRSNPFFEVADIEPKDRPSYTVDMLERFSTGDTRPCFVIGMDSLVELHTWKEPERVLELADVVAGVRPGSSPASVEPGVLGKVSLFTFPGVWISSSEIRNRVRQGRSISYLVPESVESFIITGGLYGAEEGY